MSSSGRNHSPEREGGSPNLLTFDGPQRSKASLHQSLYVIIWVVLSSSAIPFNKWILDKGPLRYPILLTTWHLVIVTAVTQILARTLKLIDGQKSVQMTGRVYIRAILPIGLAFGLNLVCGNLAYRYLNTSFIQILKATTPVVVLLASWALGVLRPRPGVLFNVLFIVLSFALASSENIKFDTKGFLYQCSGIVSEALRLVFVERLLNGTECKISPFMSLYYFAPICAFTSGLLTYLWERPKVEIAGILLVGIPELIANAFVAFSLSLSVVFLISKTSSLALTLCSILRDILLIFYSKLLWGLPITGLQVFGYGIALFGLLFYQLSNNQSNEYVWSFFRRPVVGRPLIKVVGMVLSVVILLSFLLWAFLANVYESGTREPLTADNAENGALSVSTEPMH